VDERGTGGRYELVEGSVKIDQIINDKANNLPLGNFGIQNMGFAALPLAA